MAIRSRMSCPGRQAGAMFCGMLVPRAKASTLSRETSRGSSLLWTLEGCCRHLQAASIPGWPALGHHGLQAWLLSPKGSQEFPGGHTPQASKGGASEAASTPPPPRLTHRRPQCRVELREQRKLLAAREPAQLLGGGWKSCDY